MKRILAIVITALMGISFCTTPVFAACTQEQLDNGCVNTSVLDDGCSCDDGKGSGISDVLTLVVDIMTMGVGILGLIGITVVGIQYLTAGGDVAKTKKAKRRMFEIVIGLVAYVILYAVLTWLLPSFHSWG